VASEKVKADESRYQDKKNTRGRQGDRNAQPPRG
jgi:hypothetical protein